MQKMAATTAIKTNITAEEARKLIGSKLKELNNDELNKIYSGMSPDQLTKLGVVLYLLMNGLSNKPSGYDYKAKFGGGVGVFLMFTLSQLILMPELNVMWRNYGEDYNGASYSVRFTYLALAFTALYVIHSSSLDFLVGLSPNLAYALGGSVKYGGNKQDITFGDNGANRTNFGIGVNAGIRLQNAMMLRLIYNFGISKIYKNDDPRMYYVALALNVPLWSLK